MPEPVVRDIIGHESELVSRDYTHVYDASKRDAIRRLPNIFVAPRGDANVPSGNRRVR